MSFKHKIGTLVLLIALSCVLYTLWGMSENRDNSGATVLHVDETSDDVVKPGADRKLTIHNVRSMMGAIQRKQKADDKRQTKHNETQSNVLNVNFGRNKTDSTTSRVQELGDNKGHIHHQKDLKMGPKIPLNMPPNSQQEQLKSPAQCTKDNGYYIPNIVHFLWLHEVPTQMLFTEMISIRSAYHKQNPQKIVLHCITTPEGRWWMDLQENSPRIELNFVNVSQVPGNMQSAAVMLDGLAKYGGIFAMSLDVIFIQAMDELREFEFVMGQSRSQRFIPSIVMACRKSTFINIYTKEFSKGLRKYDPRITVQDYSIAVLPYELSLKYRKNIYVETNERIARPTHK